MTPMHPRDRLLKIIHDCQQGIRLADWWNANHPDESPMDSEFERVVISKARQALEAWDRGDRDRFARLNVEMRLVALLEKTEGLA